MIEERWEIGECHPPATDRLEPALAVFPVRSDANSEPRRPVCLIAPLDSVDETDHRRANAIAALPELLVALHDAMSLMPLGTAIRAAWLYRAGAALGKAEGRKP